MTDTIPCPPPEDETQLRARIRELETALLTAHAQLQEAEDHRRQFNAELCGVLTRLAGDVSEGTKIGAYRGGHQR